MSLVLCNMWSILLCLLFFFYRKKCRFEKKRDRMQWNISDIIKSIVNHCMYCVTKQEFGVLEDLSQWWWCSSREFVNSPSVSHNAIYWWSPVSVVSVPPTHRVNALRSLKATAWMQAHYNYNKKIAIKNEKRPQGQNQTGGLVSVLWSCCITQCGMFNYVYIQRIEWGQ